MAGTGDIESWNEYVLSDDGWSPNLVFHTTLAVAGAFNGMNEFLDPSTGYAPSVLANGVFSTAAVGIHGMNVEFFYDEKNDHYCGLYPTRNVLIRADGSGIKEDEINEICFEQIDKYNFLLFSFQRKTGFTEQFD